MKINMNKLVACALLTVPGAAQAQDISGAATLGYGNGSISDRGGDMDSFTLDGRGLIAFQNGFNLGLDGSFAHADPDGSGDIGVTDVGVVLEYATFGGAVFGGYVDYADLDGNGFFNFDGGLTSYGLTGGYNGQLLQVEANVGWAEVSIARFGPDDKWRDYGVNVAYTPTENTKIAGHWQLSDVSTRFVNTNLYSIGIGASHDFGAGFIGFGGVSRVDYDALAVDATSYGLGVGYDLSQVSRLPAQVSLELARTNLDAGGIGDADVDTVRVGFTMPLGNRAKSAPLNSLADSVMTPRHNAVSTLADNLF